MDKAVDKLHALVESLTGSIFLVIVEVDTSSNSTRSPAIASEWWVSHNLTHRTYTQIFKISIWNWVPTVRKATDSFSIEHILVNLVH